MSPMRKAFCCAACDEEIWEPTSRWREGPLKGEIGSAVRPLPGSKIVTIVRVLSGNQSDITLCKNCELTEDNVAQVWRKILERDALERDEGFRRALQPMLNRPPPTAAEADWREKMKRLEQMDMPIMVLSTRSLGMPDG